MFLPACKILLFFTKLIARSISLVAWLCLTVQFSVGGNYNSSFLHKSSPTSLNFTELTKQTNYYNYNRENCGAHISVGFSLAENVTSQVTRRWIFGCFYPVESVWRAGVWCHGQFPPRRNFIAASKHSGQGREGVTLRERGGPHFSSSLKLGQRRGRGPGQSN